MSESTMKRFIDDKGTFELKVPATWKYSLSDEKVHTFQEYEIWKSDAFQLSINSLDSEEKRKKFMKLVNSLPIERIGVLDFHTFPDKDGNEFITKAWIKQFGQKAVCFTLTYEKKIDKELDNRTIEDKIKIVHSILQEFRLIEESKSTAIINSYRFDMFMQGIGATTLILNKAIENNAFIEATCVLASLIDGALRVGIVLKSQLINRNSEIPIEWVYQGLRDKKKSEKDIYKKSLELGIIDRNTFEDFYKLYEDRNRVIHRFIISEITFAEVEEIAFEYHKKLQTINKIIYSLESEQIKLGIGMTTFDSGGKPSQGIYFDYIKGKIGKENYFDHRDND